MSVFKCLKGYPIENNVNFMWVNTKVSMRYRLAPKGPSPNLPKITLKYSSQVNNARQKKYIPLKMDFSI